MANIHKNLVEDFKNRGFTIMFYDDVGRSEPKDATSLILVNEKATTNITTIRLPMKKLVDSKWLINKVARRERKSRQINMGKYLYSELLDSILSSLDAHYIETIYTTKDGFSFIIANNKLHKKIKSLIIGILDENEITYDITHSDSLNISQYRIGKSESNMDKLRTAIKEYQL